VFEDWLWHVILPLIAYLLLLVSAVFLPSHAHQVLFIIGATAMLLLFVGLHNAWDTVTYITIALPPANKEPDTRADDQPPPAATTVSDNKQAPQKPRHKFRGRK
jgi:hypothetical protein